MQKYLESLPPFGSQEYFDLLMLKNRELSHPGIPNLRLHQTVPEGGCIKFYDDTFTDPHTTQHLSISPNFDPKKFITDTNGDGIAPHFGSPTDVAFLGYQSKTGPIVHLTIKEIDWTTKVFSRGIIVHPAHQGQKIGPKAGFIATYHMQKLGFQIMQVKINHKNRDSLVALSRVYGNRIKQEPQDTGTHFIFSIDLSEPFSTIPEYLLT